MSEESINEIIENALTVLTTGADLRIYVHAIQWNRDYKPKHIDFYENKRKVK